MNEDNKKNTIRHAYYHEYRDLQRLCILILQNEKQQMGYGKRKVYGILFDGAWLWEEYLNTFLSDIGFEHTRNKEGIGHKCLFKDGTGWCYPDFLSPQIVLDAKYKWYDDWNKMQTKDFYQVISYMHVLDLKKGGFVVPVDWNSMRFPTKTLKGMGGEMSIYGMNVGYKAESFEDYNFKMVLSEQMIIDELEIDRIKEVI